MYGDVRLGIGSRCRVCTRVNTYFDQVDDRNNDIRCTNGVFDRIESGGHLGRTWSCLELLGREYFGWLQIIFRVE